MATWKIVSATEGTEVRCPNKEEASALRDRIYTLTGKWLEMSKVVKALNNWVPDSAETYILEELVSKDMLIPAIKFARMKSGNGLKDAKDWVIEQFRE